MNKNRHSWPKCGARGTGTSTASFEYLDEIDAEFLKAYNELQH